MNEQILFKFVGVATLMFVGGWFFIFALRGKNVEDVKKEEEEKIEKGLMKRSDITYDTMEVGTAVVGAAGLLLLLWGLLLLIETSKKYF